MDPNATHEIALGIARKIIADREDEVTAGAHDGEELAEAFVALHEWLAKGGFLPDAWRQGRDRSLVAEAAKGEGDLAKGEVRIAMTGTPAVIIRRADWPFIAKVKHEWAERTGDRSARAFLAIRRHADGRYLVHGHSQYSTAWQGEEGASLHFGRLIEPIPNRSAQSEALALEAAREAAAYLATASTERLDASALLSDLIDDLPPVRL